MINNKNNLNGFAISIELYDWIINNLKKDSTILEFGSGSGTIELAKHYNVISVEQSKQWVGLAPGVTYIYAPLKDGWYDIDMVFTNLPSEYDIIIIDGPAGSHSRPGIDKHWDKLNTNVPIIFDDTHRPSDWNHVVSVASLLNKTWEEIKGWEKNFIILK